MWAASLKPFCSFGAWRIGFYGAMDLWQRARHFFFTRRVNAYPENFSISSHLMNAKDFCNGTAKSRRRAVCMVLLRGHLQPYWLATANGKVDLKQ